MTENDAISQIENEYGNWDIEPYYGNLPKPYVDWAAGMATSLNTGVPWNMCQQKDAPDPIVRTILPLTYGGSIERIEIWKILWALLIEYMAENCDSYLVSI